MGTPYEDAKAVAISIYSLFYEMLGIVEQEKTFDRVLNATETDKKTITLEDDLVIGDDFFRLIIMSRSEGDICHVRLSLPGIEFPSFQVNSDAVENVPNFKNSTAPELEPMIGHIESLLKS